jgi:hypothetical protein
MYEETIYILRDRAPQPSGTMEWPSKPLNGRKAVCFSAAQFWHQHLNADANQSARYVAVTNAPLYVNLFHSKDFIYDNPSASMVVSRV